MERSGLEEIIKLVVLSVVVFACVCVCVCVCVYTMTAQAATPAITLTSFSCSEAALPSASSFGRNGGALL